ncbi:MAG: hypothetical protein RMM29_03215 [Planctomycetota bacterium]|nr:hypothetical protein [Planctomycetota bacterium]MCX8039249.1 hypothetical protein [Planctomycetota bacterium]MDW8372642.1 hypothetical protein [Planctomycetota bacterium]
MSVTPQALVAGALALAALLTVALTLAEARPTPPPPPAVPRARLEVPLLRASAAIGALPGNAMPAGSYLGDPFSPREAGRLVIDPTPPPPLPPLPLPEPPLSPYPPRP